MIVARVNDYEISEQELWAEVLSMTDGNPPEKPGEEMLRRALSNLIRGILIAVEAQETRPEVSQDEIHNELIEFMLQFKSPEEFNQMLKSSDITQEILDKTIEDKLRIKKYLNSLVTESYEADEKDLQDFYDDNPDLFFVDEVVRVFHILIKEEKGMETAERVRECINSPEDFHSVASKCSECPSCLQAGDLGYIPKGKMLKEFEEVCFSLQKNEISQPFRTQHGVHIVMVTERKEAAQLPFDSVKDSLKKRLKQIDRDLQIEARLNQLRDEAQIVFNEEFFHSNR